MIQLINYGHVRHIWKGGIHVVSMWTNLSCVKYNKRPWNLEIFWYEVIFIKQIIIAKVPTAQSQYLTIKGQPEAKVLTDI